MSPKESNAINIARFIFIIGVLFIHFPITLSSADGVRLTPAQTPIYNLISSPFFLNTTCLYGLFILSGYLYFKTIRGGYSNELYINKIDGRIKTLVMPYLFWNLFWLGYNLLKTWRMRDVADAELLHINSLGDLFACFWEKGYGSHPDFPIAGYTWFLKDLFIFALLAPIYNYCYQKKYLAEGLLVTLLICLSVKGWHIPGINAWLYIGGYIAYNGWNFENIVEKINWFVASFFFFIANVLYFYTSLPSDALIFLLTVTSFVIIMKLSLMVSDCKWLLSVSGASTFIYVTHIFILNVSRHCIVKFLNVIDDTSMCLYYILNSTICVCVCIGTYYLLKILKAKRILAIMTGGRG